jgi:hypothetical protein
VTLAAGDTGLKLSLLLNGIGIAGDNVVKQPAACKRTNGHPSNEASCLSNQDPLHPARSLTVEVLTANNAHAATVTGNIAYDQASGKFTGLINLGKNWKSGTYTLKVRTPMYLRKQVGSVHTITAGQTYTASEENLISSDVDNDNKLTILDYNLIIDCYTFPGDTPSCDVDDAAFVDVNDDGNNDEFDENLFLRDLSVQNGD